MPKPGITICNIITTALVMPPIIIKIHLFKYNSETLIGRMAKMKASQLNVDKKGSTCIQPLEYWYPLNNKPLWYHLP